MPRACRDGAPAPTTAALPQLRRSPGMMSVSTSRTIPAASHLVHSNGPWWPKPANWANSPATRPRSTPVPRLSIRPRQMTKSATHSTPEWPGTLTGTRSSCLASMQSAATSAISSRSRSVSDHTYACRPGPVTVGGFGAEGPGRSRRPRHSASIVSTSRTQSPRWSQALHALTVPRSLKSSWTARPTCAAVSVNRPASRTPAPTMTTV